MPFERGTESRWIVRPLALARSAMPGPVVRSLEMSDAYELESIIVSDLYYLGGPGFVRDNSSVHEAMIKNLSFTKAPDQGAQAYEADPAAERGGFGLIAVIETRRCVAFPRCFNETLPTDGVV